jgi:hypothetical protein
LIFIFSVRLVDDHFLFFVREMQRKGLKDAPKGFREALAERDRLRALEDAEDDDD